MPKAKPLFLMIFLLIVTSAAFPLIAETLSRQGNEKKGPDHILIEMEAGSGRNEMPAVGFSHDVHTWSQDGKCAACHEQVDNRTVFQFKRTDGAPSMELYHDNCISCHAEARSSGKAAGPGPAECGACHAVKQPGTSSWKRIAFDKNLHLTHERSGQIKGTDPAVTDNCSRCHHQYNEKTKEIFYVKGEESSCVYCHKPESRDGIRSAREASHDSCVRCHQEMKAASLTAGPVDCAGCHSEAEQSKIKKATDIPRMKRNQPDAVVMTGFKPDAQMPPATTPKAIPMDGVVFNHQLHETAAESCKSCHHDTLKSCRDCHGTDTPALKGGGVGLEQAMHKPDSTMSCVGCHREMTKQSDCAGCHASVPATASSSESCKTCHNLTRERLESETPDRMIQEVLAERATSYEIVPTDRIPEIVTMDALADEYEPSRFPHRKVVQTIAARAEKSGMAKVFHKDQAALCMGCHHNSPKSLEPPACATCHAKTGPSPDGRPGLKGAYHGQCISCHQKMDIASVPATDCAKCHEKKK